MPKNKITQKWVKDQLKNMGYRINDDNVKLIIKHLEKNAYKKGDTSWVTKSGFLDSLTFSVKLKGKTTIKKEDVQEAIKKRLGRTFRRKYGL